MERGARGWAWSKVSTIHRTREDAPPCDGEIRSYAYRYYPPSHASYERCIGLAWCSPCREYAGAMVSVPRGEHLPDLLIELPATEREKVARSEVKLIDYLDRLARRGAWPAPRR